MTESKIIELIVGMYTWFNIMTDPQASFSKTDLEKYFTPNFVMQMNDKIIVENYDSLYNHFEKFRKSGDQIKVGDMQEIVVSGDLKKCVVRYQITKTAKDNKQHTIKVIAIWHISEDHRLERMNEVVVFE